MRAPCKIRFRHKLLSLDSSMVELCAESFDCARYKKTKGALKTALGAGPRWGTCPAFVAPRHGFEPRFTAPKAAVLPLDDRGIEGKLTECLSSV